MKRSLVILLLFLVATAVCRPAFATDFGSSTVSRVLVGDEVINLSQITLPYQTSTGGARLESDGIGVKLVLSGATIGGAGIQADGNFKIELTAGTQSAVYVTEYSTEVGVGMLLGTASYGINVTHNLTITGSGTLMVNNISPMGTGVLDTSPEGVRIGRDGWYGGSLSITGGASVMVTCLNGPGVHLDNGGDVSVTLGSLAVASKDTAVYAPGEFKSEAAILCLMSSSGNALAIRGPITMEYTYGSFVTRNGNCVVTDGLLSMDHCVCTAIGSAKPCLVGSGCYFGEGEYKIATDGDSGNTAAVYANDTLTIDGADIKFCTPEAFGIYLNVSTSDEGVVHMKGGRIRMVDSVNVNEMFAYNAIAATAYGIVTSLDGYLNPAELYVDAIGSFILDYLTSMRFEMRSGFSKYGIRGRGKLDMTGGTVLVSGALTYGIGMSDIDISGGSLNGTCEVVPSHAGKELRLVTEVVAGGTSGAKMRSGWTTSLPSYYGTGSLYLDAECKLYFWVPASSGGGDSGGGDSGSGDSGGGDSGSGVEPSGDDPPATTIYRTVTFNANGGSVSERTRKVASGTAIGRLPTPTREGCEFLGWYTATRGGTKISSTTRVSADATYYAQWLVSATPVYPELRSVTLGSSQIGISDVLVVSYELRNPSALRYCEGDNLDLYVDGVLTLGKHVDWLVESEEEYSSIHVRASTLGPGSHSIRVTLRNGTGTFSSSVTVANDKTANPKMDWVFNKLRSSEPDSFYLGNSLNDLSGPTTFTVGQDIFVQVHLWNAKNCGNRDPVHVRLDLNTGASLLFTWNSMGAGVIGYLTDSARMPAFLQNLPAGNYTLTATIDPYNNWWETNENNNVKRLQFSVVDPMQTPESTFATTHRLYGESATVVAVGKGENAPYLTRASTYDGYIYNAQGYPVGMIQIKVAKGKEDRKTGQFSAKVSATVQMADGSRKMNFKNGIANRTGNITAMSANGHSLYLTLGVNGLGGKFDGQNFIDGARNRFADKDAVSKAKVTSTESRWGGVVNVVGDRVALAVSIASKGKVKISGTVNGVKVSATSQLLIGETRCCIPVVITKKANLAFNLWLMNDGRIEIVGLGNAVVGVPGTLQAGAVFGMDSAALSAALPGLLADYLPNGLAVSSNGNKWIVAGGAKAGKVVFMKGTTTVDEAKTGANPAGLKLAYKTKDGSFSGSFKAYCNVNGKPKAFSFSLTGVLVNGVGHGTAILKKPAVSIPITIMEK